MAEDIDPAVIKKTQEILGSVIKRPALTEKSLKKPPFKFLHDVITNIIKTSGFFKGLYTAEELQPENVKDKESKIAFLQKAIDVLALATNQPVNLKPSKVVAGHDPQKTNVFLQIIATSIKNKVDSKEAVSKVLSGQAQGSPVKTIKERRTSVDKRPKGDKSHSRSLTKTLEPAKKSSSSSQSKDPKSKEGEKDKTKERQRESKSKEREKSRDRKNAKAEEPKKTSKEKKHREEPEEIVGDGNYLSENVTIENETLSISEKAESAQIVMNGDLHDKEPEIDNQEQVNAPESAIEKPVREKSHRQHSSRSMRPPSARSKRTKPDENGPEMEVSREPPALNLSNGQADNALLPRPMSARPPSARPSSSRPAPPRIRVRHVVENQEPSIRPATAKPVENVIIDQGNQSEEEEDLIVLEAEPPQNLDLQVTRSLPAETPDEDKGSLVKKLLETKKDLEGGSQHTPTKKVEIDKSQMSEVSRHREREAVAKELEQLNGSISSLSLSTVPLGHMLDYLLEDVDAMKAELKMWREEHDQNLISLRREQSATQSSLEPLQSQLDDLDQVVQNQLDANSALKASIARNDERIQRMLAQVNKS